MTNYNKWLSVVNAKHGMKHEEETGDTEQEKEGSELVFYNKEFVWSLS
jgi:hypothetical protein